MTTFLFLSISFFANQPIIFAELLNQSAEEYRLKGYEEQQKENFEQALTYYSKAVSLGSQDAALYNDMGVLYEQIGIPGRAEESYLKAIKLDEDYLPPYANIAFYYKDKGDTARAIAFFQERLKRSPENDSWREKIKEELITLDPAIKQQIIVEEAKDLQDQLVTKARNEFTLQIIRADKHYQHGQELLKKNEYEEAILEFDRALDVTPDNPKILDALKQAKYEQIKADIKQRTAVALQKLELGEVHSAKKEFQNILATIPDEPIQETD